MEKHIVKISLIFFVLLMSNNSFAQIHSLSGRSAIGINLGMFAGSTSSNTATINGLTSSVSSNGFAGGFIYSHWMKENLAFKLSAGLLTGSANVTMNAFNVSQQASAVFPILLGLNYYFIEPTPSDGIRPFIGASTGIYIGSEASNTTLAQNVHYEAAVGVRTGVGVDFLVSSQIIVGVNVGYNLMSNFSTPVGGKKNYNGADFSIQLNYIF